MRCMWSARWHNPVHIVEAGLLPSREFDREHLAAWNVISLEPQGIERTTLMKGSDSLLVIRRHLAHLSLGAVALGVAQRKAQASETPSGFFGINVLWGPGDEPTLRDRFRRARALRIIELRIDWEWRIAELQRGIYDWTAFDRLVSIAHQAGVRLLPVVHYAPEWALTPAKDRMIFELALADHAFAPFARFMVACVQRYGPNGNASQPFIPITYWQIWNEPNNKEFWGPTPEPSRFAALMRIVARQLAPYRGDIHIVHAGLSFADEVFLSQLYEVDGRYGETFDVMSVHPYIFDRLKGVRQPDDMDADIAVDAELGFVGDKAKPNYLGKVFNIRQLMTQRCDAAKPIWITEIGFFVSSAWLGVSEARQTALLSDTMDYIIKRLTNQPFGRGHDLSTKVQRVYWFALDDFVSPNGMGNFGVYHADHSLRPSGELIQGFLRSREFRVLPEFRLRMRAGMPPFYRCPVVR